jgi:hypothetical protein
MSNTEKEEIRAQVRAYNDDSAIVWQLVGWYFNRLESDRPEQVREAHEFFRVVKILASDL